MTINNYTAFNGGYLSESRDLFKRLCNYFCLCAYHAITGVALDRKLVDGRILRHLHQQGQQVRLVGLKFPVTVAWYYLKRKDGRLEKRFVLSTRPLKASTIKWWGKRRWQIEGWFKTAKHRFGLHRFGQGTLLGMYRWLILSLTAYLIAHWAYLDTQLP